ncbi:acyltransferase domain-containing protein [Lipingzhangella halophila]
MDARGVEARRVADDVPAHSPLVARAAERLREELSDLDPRPAEIPMWPTALGHHAHLGTPLDGAYWAKQMRQPVAFLPTVHAVAAAYPGATWVELAGRSTLAPGVRDTLTETQSDPPQVVAAGHHSQSDDTALLSQLAHLYAHGHPPQHWPYVRQAPVRLPVAWHRCGCPWPGTTAPPPPMPRPARWACRPRCPPATTPRCTQPWSSSWPASWAATPRTSTPTPRWGN